MSGTLESVLVSLGVGLVVLAIGLTIKRVPKSATFFIAAGIGMLAYVLWPRVALVEVPDLSDLSRDEAELILSSMKLDGLPRPQEARNTRPEHVISASQNPLAGTMVRYGTVVQYSISTQTSVVLPRKDDSEGSITAGAVSIFSPRENGEVVPRRGADNIFRFDVEGTIEGIDIANSTLLLWVRPIEPPSDQAGWYLQRHSTNGIHSISGSSWRGIGQIGNKQFPPHSGDVVEVAASVVSDEEARHLESRHGPLTAVVLPGVSSSVVRFTVRLN